MISGRQVTCGTAPRLVRGSVVRRVSTQASGMSSRFNSANHVTGRALSVSSRSSKAYSLSSTIATAFVSASSIDPLPSSLSALQ